MDVFNYDKDGLFIGTEKAEISPLEPDKYLLPANSTPLKPPNESETKVAMFKDKKWVLVERPMVVINEEKKYTQDEINNMVITLAKKIGLLEK